MNKISPNLLPLSSLITKEQFINFFITCGTGPNTTNIFWEITANSNNIDLPNIFYSGSSLPSMMYLLSLNFNPSQIGFSITFLLGAIYDIFCDAIPYNQTCSEYQLVDVMNNPSIATIPVPLLQNISGFISVYLPDIKMWFYNINRLSLSSDTTANNATKTVNVNRNIDSISQNQEVNKDSFNPVTENVNISINSVPVKTQLNGGLSNNNYSDTTSANWNTSTSGNSSNSTLQTNKKEVALTELRDLGSERLSTYLKGMFKKIGTLFWVLGNDYWHDESADLGFNIW